jgi:glycosyltransferase involved in cell wall biosynthesis
MLTVSIIVPNYNHARYLRQRIESVLGQTYQDFEVILLDDCSTDESSSIIEEYANDPRVRIELNRQNSGSTFKQWTKGVLLARGKYVWIAESDDYADERLLERLVTILDSKPEVTFAYCRSWRVDQDDRPNGFADFYLVDLDPGRWKEDFQADGREECRHYFVGNNSVPNASSVLFRKAIYERVGGVDDRLRVCGDWRLWVLMAFEGEIAYVSEPLNYYREHHANVRTSAALNGLVAAEHLATVRWMLERVTPTDAVLERARSWASGYWIPAIFSRRVPFGLKRAIFRDARATDPHVFQRVLAPILNPARLKLAKELRLFRRRFEGRG